MKRVRKGIKNLCRSLVNVTAACLRVVGMAPKVGDFEYCHAPNEARAERLIFSETIAVLNRMAGPSASLTQPVTAEKGFDVFIHKLKDQKAGLSEAGALPSFAMKKGGRPRKPALEILKITMNLARGDLEHGCVFAPRFMPVF